VFTALLLSDMALRGEVALDDPAARYLPEGVAMPERGGRKITLADLATHTSGLPRSATNITPSDWVNPYGDYTPERLYAFLNDCTLTRDVGARYEYSNIGAGLLGHLLARRLDADYRGLLNSRVTGPLGMKDTSPQLSPGQAKRLAQGHDADGRPAPAWRDSDSTAAGGGLLLSTADDLLKLLAVALGYEASPLKPAIDAQLAYPMRTIEEPGGPFSTASGEAAAGLGWHAIEAEGERLVRHNGGTAGYRAFLGLNPARGWGAVVLTNTGGARGGDDIGRHILAGAPLAPGWPRRRRPIALAPSVLDRYVGRYRYPTGDWMEIHRSDQGLSASLSGQTALPIAALSPTAFFYRTIDVELSFETDGDGRAIALVTRSQARGENRAVRE
jgi:serine-type D-Ala-D-Ala carboxypeptidase/endopeptidase